MREIKFRAWDSMNKRFIADGDIYISQNGLVFGGDLGNPPLVDITNYDVVISQYTGLKDKNGKEIYEGDLITITDPFINQEAIGVAKIVFSFDYVGGWVAEHGNEHLNIGTRTHMLSVVGNIYENSELLKT